MYPEDIDLTRRINEKYKTIFYPKTFIYHAHAKESFKKIKLLYILIGKCCYFIQKRNFKHEKIVASIKKSNFELLGCVIFCHLARAMP